MIGRPVEASAGCYFFEISRELEREDLRNFSPIAGTCSMRQIVPPVSAKELRCAGVNSDAERA
jgi:hypothetical protein